MKQTLEQAAKEWILHNGDTCVMFQNKDAFKAGAIWERKRVLELLRSEEARNLCFSSKWQNHADWLEAKLSEMDKGDE